MTAYKVTVATRADLAEVTIRCDECQTKVVAKVENGKIPMACPCGKEYGEAVKNALAAFGRFHREAKAADSIAGKPVFEFFIKEEVK